MAPASLDDLPALKEKNSLLATELRSSIEESIRLRLQAIEKHMRNRESGFESLDAIFSAEQISS